MKKIYISPKTSILTNYGEGLMDNHGSVYGQDGKGSDAIQSSDGTPPVDGYGDHTGDAKRFGYDPDWSDLDGVFEIY